MSAKSQINYFQKLPNPIDQTLIQIKGNYRRHFVGEEISKGGKDSIPPAWLNHNLSETLKGFLQGQHPQARGGEDLPDLEEGEIEIARVTLANTVHREVASLRAQNTKPKIKISIFDEYEGYIELPYDEIEKSLDSEEIVDLFIDCEPPQVGDEQLEYNFQSFFYNDLNLIAKNKGLTVTELDW